MNKNNITLSNELELEEGEIRDDAADDDINLNEIICKSPIARGRRCDPNQKKKMDSSVIVVDDSIISIRSDVEDGEVNETDNVEIVNNALKSPIDTPPIRIHEEKDTVESEIPIFKVTFRNEDLFKMLHDHMVKVLFKTFESDKYDIKTNEANCSICGYEKVLNTEPIYDDDLFLIDTAPTVQLMASQVPSYKRCHTEVLDEETQERKRLKAEAVNKCFRPKAQSVCFNCGESDHSVRDCPRPRNQARIQRARKVTNNRVERYHVDTEQRFAHIRPGKISSKTRHAMGYSRGEIPFMFYRMRILGYPPAWLEEAKVLSSGMTLFNADGNEVMGPEEEEGEADSFKLDPNKIFEFPGFNVKPGPKFFDDYKHQNVPCFQESQLRENFIEALGENITKAYKRKKLIEPHDNNTAELDKRANLIELDMEVDDDNVDNNKPDPVENIHPPLPTTPARTQPQPPPPISEARTPRSPSPTLEDLTAQQALLLEQLDSSISSLVDNDTSINDTQVIIDETNVDPPPDIFKGPSIEGTPILKFSDYDKLPVGDKFKVGVSDIINFENLPDSTGKYEQMKDLLKNVRQKMDKLQNAED